jgi:hypothetical protein
MHGFNVTEGELLLSAAPVTCISTDQIVDKQAKEN